MQFKEPVSIATKLYKYTVRGADGTGDEEMRQI